MLDNGRSGGLASPDFPVNSVEAVGGSGEEVQACEFSKDKNATWVMGEALVFSLKQVSAQD